MAGFYFEQVKRLCNAGKLTLYLQPSIPRCNTNMVARTLTQSPDIHLALSSIASTTPYDSDLAWNAVVEKFHEITSSAAFADYPVKIYIKEQACFLGPRLWEQMQETASGFVFVVRDPLHQSSSEAAVVGRDWYMLINATSQRVGIDRDQAHEFLIRYAQDHGHENVTDVASWKEMALTLERAQDFRTYNDLYDTIFQDHTLTVSDYETGRSFRYEHPFRSSHESWRRSIELLAESDPQKTILIDSTILQAYPEYAFEICRNLGLTPSQTMVDGGWSENYHVSGKLRSDNPWIAKSLAANRILPAQKKTVIPNFLPGVLQDALGEKIDLYIDTLKSRSRTGIKTSSELIGFCNAPVDVVENGRIVKLIERNPTTCYAWALTTRKPISAASDLLTNHIEAHYTEWGGVLNQMRDRSGLPSGLKVRLQTIPASPAMANRAPFPRI